MRRKEINEKGWDQYAANWDQNKQQSSVPGLAVADHGQLDLLGDEWNLMCKSIKYPYGIDCFSNEEFKEYIWKNLLELYLPRNNDLSIMEIGPGGGRITQMLLPRTRELYAVDISKEMLAQLKKKFSNNEKVKYIMTDGNSISGIPENSLDCMVTFDCFVHVEPHEIYRYLEITKDLLKDGGIGIIHFSDMETEIGFEKFCHDAGGIVVNGKTYYSFSVMTKGVMKKFMGKFGFEILTLTNDILPRDAIVVFRKNGTKKRVISDHNNEQAELDCRNMLGQAIKEIDSGNLEVAFVRLNRAKSLKYPMQGLDLLRAVCLVKLNRMTEVRECLKEELRYFPNNASARKMLSDLDITYPKQVNLDMNDPEFTQIYHMVSDYTMVPPKRLYSLYKIIKNVCIQDIAGDVVECGVAGGGSTALMAYIMKKYSKRPRTLYAFDSFDGMPEPTELDTLRNGTSANDTGWGAGTCAAPIQSVREICAKLGVSEIVKPVKGYFQDTLPQNISAIGPIAFMHVDGDWYESTKCILENLYAQVVEGGLVQIDDYGYWAGCRKAVHEFEQSICVNFSLNQIDGTGVWFSKPENVSFVQDVNGQTASNVSLSSCVPEHQNGLRLLNLGCGSHYHPSWINVDVRGAGPSVIPHDLNKPLVCEDNSFNVVYHSHVLEHLSKGQGSRLMSECHRVLKPGGIIRVVVPDLEQMARWYLALLEDSLKGVKESQDKYEWIKLELLDQLVRNYSGGEMLKYWKQEPLPAKSFVIERVGSEVLNMLESIRRKKAAGLQEQCKEETQLTVAEIGKFKLSGENHQWMYDRYSLAGLLEKVGFAETRVCRADESMIPDFNSYLLDIEVNGSVRKPDSLFIEGIKSGV